MYYIEDCWLFLTFLNFLDYFGFFEFFRFFGFFWIFKKFQIKFGFLKKLPIYLAFSKKLSFWPGKGAYVRLMSELVSVRRGWIEEQRQISLEWARVTPRWDWWRHWTRWRESRSWLVEEDGTDEEGESKGGFEIALLCSAYNLQPTTWVKWHLTSELEVGRCQQPTRCNTCLMCWVHSTTFVFYFTSVIQMVSANTMNTKFYCVSCPKDVRFSCGLQHIYSKKN